MLAHTGILSWFCNFVSSRNVWDNWAIFLKLINLPSILSGTAVCNNIRSFKWTPLHLKKEKLHGLIYTLKTQKEVKLYSYIILPDLSILWNNTSLQTENDSLKFDKLVEIAYWNKVIPRGLYPSKHFCTIFITSNPGF